MPRLVVTGPGGGSPNRLEINTFVKNEKYFSLYIQALQQMQDEPQNDTKSFFQVGGIHGWPYTRWDGTTVNPTVDLKNKNQWAGYCTHDSVLFPTWHRPYISLFEQILWNHAREVAAKYTIDQAAWKAAAATLRQPYWDWAANSVPPAEVVSLSQVKITDSDGKRKLVDNPLRRYKFHPLTTDPPLPGRFKDWSTTLRQPKSEDPDAEENVVRLKAILKNVQTSIRTNTYFMLTDLHTWPGFSNHTVSEGGSRTNSLEKIHDNIHWYVGGIGHMSNTAVAAFDPIFYLHHCNVDRMLSLWSALHPDVWVTKGSSVEGSITIPLNVSVDNHTNLTPFHNTETSFWASAGVTDTSTLGYTYPEFNDLDTSNPDTVQKAISGIVAKLYERKIFGVSPPHPRGPTRGIAVQALATQDIEAAAEDNNETVEYVLGTEAYRLDWTARIEYKKFEIGDSFSVLLFLGQVPEDPEDYLISPSLIGAQAAFVNSIPSRCENCQNHVDLIQEGFVHLSRGILEHGQLGSLEADVVEPYLTKELHWRAIKADSSPVEIPSLEVSVLSTTLMSTRGPGSPTRGESRRHNGITYGRPGGSREAP